MDNRKVIISVFIITLIVRLAVSFYFSNYREVNYWEYGPLAENMVSGNGYCLFYLNDGRIDYRFNSDVKPLASAYMMPGYPLFLAALFEIQNTKPKLLLFMIQAFLSALTAVFLYLITKQFTNNQTATAAAMIYALLPEMIYTTVSVGPTVFFHLLLLAVLYVLMNRSKSLLMIILIGLLLMVLLYLSPSLILFVIILAMFFVFRKKYKAALIIITICVLGLAPWVIRNYEVFNRFIPFTTSAGLNFYRGHNPEYPGFWSDDNIALAKLEFASEQNYEVLMNDYYFRRAFGEIKENPGKEILVSFQKLFHLWTIYPYDSRTSNLLYLLPWLVLLPFAILSIVLKFDFERKKYIYFFLLSSSLMAMFFFALLRYQTLMKIALIPLAAEGLFLVWELYKQKKIF